MGSGYRQLINWNRENPEDAAAGWQPVSDPLDTAEIRVLGALLEKEITTPDYYPLSLNALVNACNQRSNRNPVVDYSEADVAATLESLKAKGLAHRVTSREQRVPKFKQQFTRRLTLTPAQTAVLGVLMLRGPLTPGEIRSCSGRLHEFADLEEVDTTLAELAERPDTALVVRLARQPGQKEARFAHCLAGTPDAIEDGGDTPSATAPAGPKRAAPPAADDRLAELAAEMTRLREDLDELVRQFAEFRRQFD
ncbi:MAG: YceH family protein [Acidobacteria bacterium]|nr:YceH family protein [Acidobacteriota bacterium]